MTPRIPRWTLGLLAVAACWPAASSVRAQSSDVDEIVVNGASTNGETVRHQWVYYADLDLGREPGARALLARIRSAARHVCEPDPSIHDLLAQTSYRVCLHNAISGALRRVGDPRVANLYEGEG